MTIYYINTGSSANKGDGDTLRTAFNKINTNFASLAQEIGSTSSYVLPTASTSTVGGIKVGANLTISNGVLSALPPSDSTFTVTNISYFNNDVGYLTSSTVGQYVTGGTADTGSWTFDTVTATTDGNIIVKAGSGTDAWASLLSNNGANSFWVDDVGAHVTSNFIEGETTENYWTFGADGVITLPGGNTQISNQGMASTASSVVLASVGATGGAALEWISDTELSTSTKIAFVIANNTLSANSGTVQIATGGIIFNGPEEPPVLENVWDFGTNGILTTPGHILPDTDLAYDLGSTTTQWRSIYVGTGTIYIGGVALGVSADNYVTVDGNPIITINTAGNLTLQGNVNIGTVTVSDTAPTATTGTQWFDTVNGRTYIAYNNQWVDANPTQIPSPSTYLDDIQVDGSTLSVGDYAWTFGGATDTFPGDIYDAEGPIVRFATTSTPPTRVDGQLWFNSEEGRTYIKYNGAWVDANPTQIPGPETYLDDIQVDGSEFLINGYSLTVDETGTLLVDGQQVTGSGLTDVEGVVTFPGNFLIGTLWPNDPMPGGDKESVVWAKDDTEYLGLWWGGSQTYPEDGYGPLAGIMIGSNDEGSLTDDFGMGSPAGTKITLAVNGDMQTMEWIFDRDGLLTLPDGGTIAEDSNNYAGSIKLTPSGGTSATQALLIYPTAQDGNHIHLTAGGGETDLYLGSDSQFVKVDHSGAIVIGTIGANTSTWTFGTDGNITLPGNILGQIDSNISIVTGNLPTDPPTTIAISGADFSAVNLTYTRDFGQATPTWYPAGYNPGSDPYILFDTQWGIWVPGFGQALYINTGTSNVPLAQWSINPPLGSIAPTGVYTYPNTYSQTWTFGSDGELILPTGGRLGVAGKGWTGLDGGFGNPLSLTSYYASEMYSSCITLNQNGSLDISTYGDGTGLTGNWNFSSSGITFPDATIQTTAWNDQSFMAAMATYDGEIITNTATIGVGGLVVNGPVTFNGPFTFQSTATTAVTGNTGTFYGDVNGVGALYAGVAGYSPLPGTVIQSAANVNAYIQNNFQNLSNGTQASAEWVVTANNGDDSNHYLDMGIAGGGWNGTQANSVGTAASANDSWLYAQGSTSTSAGGNLILGTIKNGKSVKILTGSTGSSSIVATFNSRNQAATSTATGSLQVVGGIGVSGTSYFGGNVTANKFYGDGSSLTNVTVNIAGNILGTGTNVSLVAGSYSYTFDNGGTLTLPAAGGNEGAEIDFVKAPNSSLSGTAVVVDQYVDRLRFFENSGTNRGVYIDLTQAAAGVGTLLNNRVSAFVNSGTFVTMDNIKATVTTGGNRGLSLATVSGSFTYNIGGTYGAVSSGGGASATGTLTTSPTTSIFAWSFFNQGDISTYIITNTSSLLVYRITVQIGGSYLNNMISIERLV